MLPAVLIVEDEPAMSRLLAQAFRESGMAATVAEDGAAGLRLAPAHDLLVVDVMMPVMNGFEMVRRLRAGGHGTPVLFLTARDGADDVVKALRLGGDDYLVKPFRLAELLARVEALWRRARMAKDALAYADVEIDRRARRATRAGAPVPLSNTEFALLETFLLQPEEVVSKAALLRRLWDEDASRDDNIVEAFVRNLRQKLEAGGAPRLVHTVRGQGYVLEARAPEP